MPRYVIPFRDLDRTRTALVGGKGAHLGELCRIEGVHVPPGCCITAAAYRQVVPALDAELDQLAQLAPDDRAAIHTISATIRQRIEHVRMPDDMTAQITGALGEYVAYAVRSSATAEDSPTASFAGQHDSYLNVVGAAAVLAHVRRCWASLFSERAVSYRLRQGLDSRHVSMAVVVQRMVQPQAAGIMFTADPVTGHRRVTTVDAGFGLGEALVSGAVEPDAFRLRDGVITDRTLAHEPAALTDAQVVRLARLGQRIQAHFDSPQDIEWCLADDEFHIVQSRPITTLFPIPRTDDGGGRVYVSVGHQQMMTDAIRPLGISVWQLTAGRPMYEAGSRLFVDVTTALGSPASRSAMLDALEKSDPLITDALQTVLDRGDVVPSIPDEPAGAVRPLHPPATIPTDPAIVAALVAASEASQAALERDIATQSGPALLDFILADIQELRRILFDPRSLQVIMAALEATWWLNEKLHAWLGEKHAADTLTLSVPGNITSEMGLALLDVADAIRPHPDVIARLEHVRDDDFLDTLPEAARHAMMGWLERYGMRCVGEIDITRPRWNERPATLVPALLANVRNFEHGASRRRFAEGLHAAARYEQDLLERLRALPDGAQKAAETRGMIERVRTFMGYREYPKYVMVSRYSVYRQALLKEARALVQDHVLRDEDDVFFLTLPELHELVRTRRADDTLIRARRATFQSHQALRPPRVLTSDGERIDGAYRRAGLPAGALVGLPASSGTVEGRARIILDLATAVLEPGDILVTTSTDPGWTPLFVAAAGLVTEVGGMMTHGAVIAREYGLPAVVGVQQATRLIRDGQMIRLHGGEGYVEFLA